VRWSPFDRPVHEQAANDLFAQLPAMLKDIVVYTPRGCA
jgi:hypothetical protein